MPFPDNYSATIADEAQGTEDDTTPPADCYDAARDLLFALDRGFLTVNRPDSGYVTALRDAVAAEKARRDADEAELRATWRAMSILSGRVVG